VQNLQENIDTIFSR